MSFKDEYEVMTGVPFGHTAWYILDKPVPAIAEPAPKRSRYRSKTQQTLVSLMEPEERLAKRRAAMAAKKGCYFVEQADADRERLGK